MGKTAKKKTTGEATAKSADLLDSLKTDYRRFCAERHKDPFYSPVLRLALGIGARIQDGRLNDSDIAATVERMNIEGLSSRSARLAAYLGECTPPVNEDIIKTLIEGLARDDNGKGTVPFEMFRSRIERVYYGFVFTAHPTFTMNRPLSRALARHAASISRKGEEAIPADMALAALERFVPPDLNEESEFALEAIGNLHGALALLYKTVFDVGVRLYPERWTELRPRLCTIASWVGFDLDGRNDIFWTATLAKRFLIQIRQLEHYQSRIESAVRAWPDETGDLDKALVLISNTLEDLRRHYMFFEGYDPKDDPGYHALQNESQEMVRSAEQRLTRPERLIAILEGVLKNAGQDFIKKEILVLLSQLENIGLSRAEVHFRINAAQMHNTVRKLVDLTTHPADPRFRQTYMDRLLAKFRAMQPANIHFGTILDEQASARRLFMLIQQIVKHIDGHAPVRFLIAETESSFTVMTALYHARRFGIDEHVDICPLFETERALQRGSRIIDHLLAIPEFRNYIRKRGRLCIQTGYSDAGRYIGQTPAGGSIERLKERVARLLRDYDMGDVALLFFDTHGESIGRGGHPEGLRERMAYIAPPEFLNTVREYGIPCIQESSFQGGDGYLYFMAPETCLATMTRVLEYWLAPEPAPKHDPFYEDRTGMTEFFMVAKEMQARFMDSADYGALLSAYGSNLLRASGSRAIKRQYDYSKGDSQEKRSAKEFRAIPHNAILAQMGLFVNTVSGLGSAIEGDPPYYRHMIEASPRFRTIMRLAQRGAELSNPDTMKAYIDTLDPMLWLMRSANTEDPVLAQKYAAIAAQLEKQNLFGPMSSVFREIYADFSAFGRQAMPPAEEPGDEQAALAVLNALRLALIHRIYILAMDIPGYSPQHDMSRDALIQHILRLDVPLAVRELREIFPVLTGLSQAVDYGEESTYKSEDKESYEFEQSAIFAPMLRLYDTILNISGAVAHHIGFIG